MEGQDYNELTLNEQLKDLVDQYFNKHSSLTLNAFASRSGTSATTLRRITNGVTKCEPAPHVVLNIVSYIYKEKALSKLIAQVKGPIGDMLKQCFGQYIFDENTPHVYMGDLNNLFQDKHYYFIYKLAANKNGTHRIYIHDLFGDLGLEKLKDLIQYGVIQEDEDEKLHAKFKDFSTDIEIAKKHLPELVRFYKPEKLDEGKNIFYSLSESLNDEAIGKIKEIQREAVKKIHQIMSEDKSRGVYPYFMITLSDTMNLSENTGILQ